MKDNHIKVSIKVSGNEKVCMVSKFGWLEEMSVVIDSVNSESAHENIKSFLEELQLAPFNNCVSNEEFVEVAEKQIAELLAHMRQHKGGFENFEVISKGAAIIDIHCEPYYVVEFGEADGV